MSFASAFIYSRYHESAPVSGDTPKKLDRRRSELYNIPVFCFILQLLKKRFECIIQSCHFSYAHFFICAYAIELEYFFNAEVETPSIITGEILRR